MSTAFERQMARKAERERRQKSPRMRCKVTHKRRDENMGQRWLVTCSGNPRVQYVVMGPLMPRYCPACGRSASSEPMAVHSQWKPDENPILRQRECGGWLAVTSESAPVRIGVTGKTEAEARQRFAERIMVYLANR